MKKYLPSGSEIVKFLMIVVVFNLVLRFAPVQIRQYLQPPA